MRDMAQDLAMESVLLKWQELFAVGHQALDFEHMRLVSIINQIHQAESGAWASRQLAELTNTLYLAAMEHFRHENALMRDIITGAYLPQASRSDISEAVVNEHCAEHANALIELETMLHSFASRDGASLAIGLKDWFVDHALKHDAHLRAFFHPEDGPGSEIRSGEISSV